MIGSGGGNPASRGSGTWSIYAVSGAIEFFYGDHLEHSVVVREGDFLFIPAGVPHKTYNLSLDQPGIFVTARNDPREQENVVVTPEADDGSAESRVVETRKRYSSEQH
jgi:uncharacterized RmlC-like cupin family protein